MSRLWLNFSWVKKTTTFQKKSILSYKTSKSNIISLTLNRNLLPYNFLTALGFVFWKNKNRHNAIPFSYDRSSGIWRQQLYSYTAFYCAEKELQFLNECVKLHALILSIWMSSLREGTRNEYKFRYASIDEVLDLISFCLEDISYWFLLIY